MDRVTGEPLTEDDTKDYKCYIQRHNERRATARRADKLVKIAGAHKPRIEEELRIFVGKHPWKIAELLAEAKKVFKAVTKEVHKGEQHQDTGTKKTRTAEKSKKKPKDKT